MIAVFTTAAAINKSAVNMMVKGEFVMSVPTVPAKQEQAAAAITTTALKIFSIEQSNSYSEIADRIIMPQACYPA